MADSPNSPPPPQLQEDLKYLLYTASNTNVSNFVSLKLSSNRNYHLWEAQILCLMETYNLHGIVDSRFIRPRALSSECEKQFNSLVKGWIFGSISEELLATVFDLRSAEEVWEKLKSFSDPTIISSQQAERKPEVATEDIERGSTRRETEDVNFVSAKTETKNKDSVADMDMASTDIETENKDDVSVETQRKGKETNTAEIKGSDKNPTEGDHANTEGSNEIIHKHKELLKAIMQGRWSEVESTLKEDKAAATEAINSDGNTVLHIAVGIGRNNLVREILSLIEDIELPKIVNLDGRTALHIAAIVGNTEAATLLIEKNRRLLEIQDHKGETPLDKAYENIHPDTFEYLLKAANDDLKAEKNNDLKTKKKFSPLENPDVKVGVNLLVNAVSAKQYDLAIEMVKKFPEFAVENDNVLMAIARTFPSGLDYAETLIYPIMDDKYERIVETARGAFKVLVDLYEMLTETVRGIPDDMIMSIAQLVLLIITMVPVRMLLWICYLIRLLIYMVYFPFFMCYFLLWKVSTRLVAPIKYIEKKKKEMEEAKEVLKLVCDEIDKLESPDAHPRYYTRPILEAARQNACEVVDEILMRSPGAIRYKDKNGYDIIQLAVIHRSEKIYNLLYVIGLSMSVHRITEDSSKNNMLHLVGRLPPHKPKSRGCVALQLQRDLQWREEVKKLVIPSFISKENIFLETPDMVFTREHADMVKEGENWMKAVANSCSITAALITTIVFAATITVPGGSNQNTGIPLFTGNIAFTIFAISDAISLFASSTSLLMFMSIFTGRFDEQDFLVSLPRRLVVGLCTLMLSIPTMIVAFGATLFLVFCHREPWMLALICVLASLPIASFGTIQMAFTVDLFRSTYIPIFGKPSNHNNYRFNPLHVRLFLGK